MALDSVWAHGLPRALVALLATAALAGDVVLAGQRIPQDDADIIAVEAERTPWALVPSRGVPVDDLLRDDDVVEPPDLVDGAEQQVPDPALYEVPRAAPPTDPHEPSFVWPVRGRLTSLYGRRRRALHTGLDIAATPGTIVTAAASGRVVRAGPGWGRYGKAILIDHGNGWCTLYAHASRLFVESGVTVTEGQAIAAVGRTGNATGPHLHFELWESNQAIDPLRFLGPLETPKSASLAH